MKMPDVPPSVDESAASEASATSASQAPTTEN